jgi:cellulose biosynthesis protein BcsQ
VTVGTIVAISNEKGGTGKTTLAVNLGAALAIRGRKTLLIDMDPQGNASYILAKITDEDPAMYSVLTEKDIALDAIIQPTATENLDIAPSNLHLAGAEIQLATLLGRENALKRKQDQLGSHVRILGLVANRYDRREKVSAEVLTALKQQFSSLLFETVVRVNVRLKEAPSYRQSIYEYDPVCSGAKDHLALANELIKKIE